MRFASAFFLALMVVAPAYADEHPSKETPSPAAEEKKLPPLQTVEGPGVGPIGNIAEIDVPAGDFFVKKESTGDLLERTGNIPSGNELGAIINRDEKDSYWALFYFDDIGFIKDPEKEKLDAPKMLDDIRETNAKNNEERRKRGLDEMKLIGWYKEPFYNHETQRLEWGLRYQSKEGETINYHTRILGRYGVMRVIIVASPEDLPGALPKVTRDLTHFRFQEGNRYSEWRQGDKLATIGLTALIAGGAGAALVSSGLLAKLWKLIVVGVVGLFAAIKRLFSREIKPELTKVPPPPTEPKV